MWFALFDKIARTDTGQLAEIVLLPRRFNCLRSWL